MKSQRKQFAATSHNFPILRSFRALSKVAGNETQNSNPSAPAIQIRQHNDTGKRYSYVVDNYEIKNPLPAR